MPKRSVLITGCSKGGIGETLALEFSQNGLQVFATARNMSKIAHLQGLGIHTVSLDVTDEKSIIRAVKTVAEASDDGLDFLVNNSGLGYSSPLLDANLDDARAAFEVNFFGRAAVTQYFAPLLLRSKGTIINIGSIAAYYPSVWQGMYGASCAAVHQWSDVLRIEMEPFGVKVILVVTGAVSTKFIENLPTKHLVANSIYLPGKESIEALINGTSVKDNFVPREPYGKQVVNNALKASPSLRLWAGGAVTRIWAVSTFLWATAWDTLTARQTGISDLKKNLKRE